MKKEDIDPDLVKFAQEPSPKIRVIPAMPQEEEMKQVRTDLEEAFSQPISDADKVSPNQNTLGNAEATSPAERIGPRNPQHPLVRKGPGGRTPSDT
jgi:hypothetical protein